MLVFHLLEKCITSVVQMQPRLSQKLGIRKYWLGIDWRHVDTCSYKNILDLAKFKSLLL